MLAAPRNANNVRFYIIIPQTITSIISCLLFKYVFFQCSSSNFLFLFLPKRVTFLIIIIMKFRLTLLHWNYSAFSFTTTHSSRSRMYCRPPSRYMTLIKFGFRKELATTIGFLSQRSVNWNIFKFDRLVLSIRNGFHYTIRLLVWLYNANDIRAARDKVYSKFVNSRIVPLLYVLMGPVKLRQLYRDNSAQCSGSGISGSLRGLIFEVRGHYLLPRELFTY